MTANTIIIDRDFSEQIYDELNKILSSSAFKASKRRKDFLKFIVEEAVEGRADMIKAYTIGVNVFGRGEIFNPQNDPIVSVEAGRLREALGTYYIKEGRNSRVRIDIPKGTFKPLFTKTRIASGLDTDLGNMFGSTMNTIGRIDGFEEQTIGVLPLKCLKADTELEFFAEGLTEELTLELSRYQELLVIASQTTLRVDHISRSYLDLGREIGARFLVDGTVRQDTDTIKINIKLVDSLNAQQIWGEGFKRDLSPDSLIKIQEEIASYVIGCLADQFGVIAWTLAREARREQPPSMKSYDALLQFYKFEYNLTAESFEAAVSRIHAVVENHPDYGLAWSILGHLYADNHALGFLPVENSLEKAEKFANKGVGLIPQSQFAHDALSLIYFHKGEKEKFMECAEKALSLNPNAPYIVGVAGWHMMLLGEWERGEALLRRGIRSNPRYPSWFHLALFAMHYHRGNYAGAYQSALDFNYPQLFWDQVMRIVCLAEMGKTDECRKVSQELLELNPDFPSQAAGLIGNYIKVDDLVQAILAGLKKSGSFQ